jgi:superfamily II DNA or RNA helicase/diadenosine tetraphosphate (Ap4A) HIT family hydrolase
MALCSMRVGRVGSETGYHKAVVADSMSDTDCPFCTFEAQAVFYTGEFVIGIWDAYPLTIGHALLLTKRHVASWFDATPQERSDLTDAITFARDAILKRCALKNRPLPDGFNIGVNVGQSAGQTVFHLHLHIIPRNRGDVPDPRGGIRHIFPEKANYRAALDRASLVGDAPHAKRLITGGLQDALIHPLRDSLDSARSVDIAAAFVLESGMDLIAAHLQELLERGGSVRFLTGDYMDATDPRALRRLLDMEGDIQRRVFESTRESFHPKAYMFAESSGSGVAYVGSSNLTDPALTNGIEWNYRISSTEDPIGFEEVARAFAKLFNHPATRPLDADWIDAYTRRRKAIYSFPIDVAPEPPRQAPIPNEIQRAALEALERTRAAGNSAGLVVFATGLGKTYLAALDSDQPKFQRVLFVAHREELLAQARETFRWLRPDARMGSYTGQEKLPDADLIFASIQTLGRIRHLRIFDRHAFDYIVVDEFHHAAASTYRRLIDYFQPQFLLGLTATPERTDGGDLLTLCQENLVYRCDFVEGIRRGLLCPFHYFGVPDEVDYANIPWRSSRFDEEELTKALATKTRAQNALEQYKANGGTRTLAFCCSQRHADFMAEFFREAGVRAASVHSGPRSDPRAGSLEKLRDGDLDVVFAVDMFNEGVDVPQVDTVMMLRPTESRLLWLQQFGRGLRKFATKPHLTVIDYIGNHRTFLLKPQTLFQLPPGDSAIDRTLKQVLAGEADLPPGCEVTYDLRAVDIIRGLLRLPKGDEALKTYYEDFRERYGVRPTAAEAFHEGYSPRSARRSYGSWIRFVQSMGDLSSQQNELLRSYGALFDALEITPMVKSYKMVLLLAMLNEDSFPGEIEIGRLTQAFAEAANRSARLRQDVSVSLSDSRALQRLLEENPVAAWSGGEGTGDVKYFAYENGMFRLAINVSPDLHEALQQLVREIIDWRLGEYLERSAPEEPDRFVCKVSHSNKRPILFLPDRAESPHLPSGWTDLSIEGERYEGNFAKIALNVVRRRGSDDNELPGILRRWFGPNAGMPGTDFRVALDKSGDGYLLVPVGRADEALKLEVGRSYSREQIPALFGLPFKSAIWQTGFVVQQQHMFLLVTLEKKSLEEQFRYRDHFVGPNIFEWQSQNRTMQRSSVGQAIKHHRERQISVHLFVRRHPKQETRAAPFVYCGQLEFLDWDGENPISVRWRLMTPLSERLQAFLGSPELPTT